MKVYSIIDLPGNLYLGKQTETGVREVRIDCAPWFALWPDLFISVWVTPPGATAAYPAVIHMEGDLLAWPITDVDTAVAGGGYVEIMGTAEGQKKLSTTIPTLIQATTTGTTSEPPSPAQPWVDQVLDAAKRAENAADRAEEVEGGGDGTPGTDGEDGGYYTPSVTQINENTMRVSFVASKDDMPTITDQEIALPAGKDGEPGQPGKDGEKGAPGKDGTSVIHSWNGTTLTVISASGTSSADLKGDTGLQGPIGADGVGIENAYVNDSYQLVIEKTDGSGYVSESIRGPIGPIGPIGPVGATGATGAQGEQGPQGEKGDTGEQGPQGEKGDTGEQGSAGADGQRGSKILKVTTSTTSYTTTVGGFKPTYRMPLSNVLAESGSDDVQVGDVIWRSYYHYPVGYVDADYVYLGAYVNIRGTTGAAGEDGADGQPGADGYTPVRGTDYWTEADQESIVQQVLANGKFVNTNQGSENVGKILIVGADGNLALADTPASMGGDVVGFVDSSNNIVLTGMLASGEYTVKYEMDDGTVQNIGTITVGASTDSPTYINLFDPSTAQINMRLSSSNVEKAQNGTFLTDYIDLGDVMASGGENVLHGKGFRFDNDDTQIVTYVHYYDADKTLLGYEDYNTPISYKTDADGNPYHTLDATKTTARYVRITGLVNADVELTASDISDIIITLNELIGA